MNMYTPLSIENQDIIDSEGDHRIWNLFGKLWNVCDHPRSEGGQLHLQETTGAEQLALCSFANILLCRCDTLLVQASLAIFVKG